MLLFVQVVLALFKSKYSFLLPIDVAPVSLETTPIHLLYNKSAHPEPPPPPPPKKKKNELTNRMWFSVVCTLIDNDIRHHSGQNVVRQVSPQQILTTVMTNIVVDKSADNAKPHSLCFLPQYQRPRKFLQ